MSEYRVIVPRGAVLVREGPLSAVKEHVESSAPLRRGWTARWAKTGPNSWCYRRFNAKGVWQHHMDITVTDRELR